jgi:hypothetical protein
MLAASLAQQPEAHWLWSLLTWPFCLGFIVPNLVKTVSDCPRCHSSFFYLGFASHCWSCRLPLDPID